QNAQSLGVCSHYAILDSIVNHLDEMPGAVWPTVQIAEFGGAVEFLTSRRSRNVARTGRQRLEDRIEALDYLLLAADHHAVAAIQAPDAAARTDVHVVDPLRH